MRNLLILAKWLAGRAAVDVVEYAGSTACIGLVNGRRVIKIPSHWSYSVDPEAAELLEGVIDHEALGHGRFTDLEGRRKAEDEGLIKFNAFSSGIQNILEDIYIENRAIETYPGVKANLARTVAILVTRDFFGSPELFLRAKGAQLLTGGLLNVLRSRLVPGQDEALRENVEALEVILPTMLGQLWDDVLTIAMEVQHSTSTADNIGLTIRIMKMIEDAANQRPQDADEDGDSQDAQDQAQSQDEDPQQEQESSGADQSSVDDDDQPSRPSDDAPATPEASVEEDDGDDVGTPGEDGKMEGEGQPSADQSSSSCPGDQPSEESPDAESSPGATGKPRAGQAGRSEKEIQAARSIIESQDEEMLETEIGEAISEAIQKCAEQGYHRSLVESDRTIAVPDQALRVASQVKSIADDLQDALIAETQCVKSTKLVGKSLNNRVLSRVRLGNTRVFRHKQEGAGLSTAVHLVVDMSSSMKDPLSDGKVTRLEAAIGLAFGMGDILDEYSVPFQVNTYSDSYATLKRFDDDWTQVRRKREQPHIAGGTCTGLAVQKALCDLVVRPEERRLMMVITDGDTSDLDLLISCYAEAQEMGIEVASVMIGPLVPSIAALAKRFGFKAKNLNVSTGLGRYAVERVLEAI